MIGSIVEDPAISSPVDTVWRRKNATAIWQLAAGTDAGHGPAIRTSPAEIEALADGADVLLAGRRAFRAWKDAQSFDRSAVGHDLLPGAQIIDECGTA
ncbi:hypothetical protein [Paraburkholderia sp. LEh10]|uniref:hypothetical protein n=1 Tax=Paraburkholderia sp. LEh10 TaxID=2821353 RepID=UPI001FD79DBA|nr:hypothetical protein [Paraburkholderia sp. LEh10]